MKIKNKTKRLIVLNYKESKGYKSLPVGAGQTVENEHLTEADVKYHVNKKELEEVVEEKKKKAPELVVLPENPTHENLKKDFTVPQLRAYCKQVEITVPTGSKEDDIIALILASLAPQE